MKSNQGYWWVIGGLNEQKAVQKLGLGNREHYGSCFAEAFTRRPLQKTKESIHFQVSTIHNFYTNEYKKPENIYIYSRSHVVGSPQTLTLSTLEANLN